MSFLQSLIKWISTDDNKSQQDADDHYDMLERLRKNHDWIEVRVTQTDKTYQSLILEVNPQSGELVIDELYPSEGLKELVPGDTVEVVSQSRRALVNFYSRILAHEQKDGSSLYRLELPEEVGRNHSRGAYRVYVGGEEGLGFSMGLENELELAITITNLSVEGIKLSFAEDVSDQLKHHLIHRDCLIQLPNEIDIDCSLEIKNIYRIHRPHLHSLAGGIINIPNPQHRAKLNQYLTGVQRKQRRRELRE